MNNKELNELAENILDEIIHSVDLYKSRFKKIEAIKHILRRILLKEKKEGELSIINFFSEKIEILKKEMK